VISTIHGTGIHAAAQGIPVWIRANLLVLELPILLLAGLAAVTDLATTCARLGTYRTAVGALGSVFVGDLHGGVPAVDWADAFSNGFCIPDSTTLLYEEYS